MSSAWFVWKNWNFLLAQGQKLGAARGHRALPEHSPDNSPSLIWICQKNFTSLGLLDTTFFACLATCSYWKPCLGSSRSGSVIWDHLDNKEPTNPPWERIHGFIWCASCMIQVISDYRSRPEYLNELYPLCLPLQSHTCFCSKGLPTKAAVTAAVTASPDNLLLRRGIKIRQLPDATENHATLFCFARDDWLTVSCSLHLKKVSGQETCA